jgi:hypothetical protein
MCMYGEPVGSVVMCDDFTVVDLGSVYFGVLG